MNRTNAFITWFSVAVLAIAAVLTVFIYANLGSGQWVAIPITSRGPGGGPIDGPRIPPGPDVLVCVDDLRTYCTDARGGPEHLQCLSANLTDLSAECQASLASRM